MIRDQSIRIRGTKSTGIVGGEEAFINRSVIDAIWISIRGSSDPYAATRALSRSALGVLSIEALDRTSQSCEKARKPKLSRGE